MTEKTHRTVIRIETHEVKVIRFGTRRTGRPIERVDGEADVRGYTENTAIQCDETVAIGPAEQEEQTELKEEQ